MQKKLMVDGMATLSEKQTLVSAYYFLKSKEPHILATNHDENFQ